MYDVGEELYLRDSEVSHSTVAVILETRPDDPARTYFVFTAGVRSDRPFSETRWVSQAELDRDVQPETVDREKIGIEFLAVTGNKVDQFVFYALNEMRDLMQEAAEIEATETEETMSFREKASLLDAQVRVREHRGYDVAEYRKECEISARVT